MKEPRGKLLVKLLEKLNGAINHPVRMIEIGCIRSTDKRYTIGDGYSTLYLSRWASDNQAQFTSIELDPYHIESAKEILSKAGCPEPEFILGHSLDVLGRWNGGIDFVYLDGAGEPAVNLEEFKLVEKLISKPGIVAIDDCFGLPEPQVKGGRSVEYATIKGLSVLHMDRMAVIPFGIEIDAL